MKKTILVNCPNHLDATSFYRAAGPLTSLVKTNNIELIFDDKLDWPSLKLADLVFFQRPASPEAVEQLDKALNAGIPVWTDYDDLLMSVPDSNPHHRHYKASETQAAIWQFLQHSDYLTVATPALAEATNSARFGNAKPPIVIPNALDEVVMKGKHDAAHPGILWRGSGTHDEDLHSVLDALARMKALNWNFIGQPYWLALRQLKDYKLAAWKDLPTYNRLMEFIRATVQIVPLADNGFNRCKSNIAWIEGSRVGSVIVAPNWAEWQRPGILTYDTVEQFEEQVRKAYSDLDFVKAQNKLSWDYIMANLRLSEVNKKRLEIIEGAL